MSNILTRRYFSAKVAGFVAAAGLVRNSAASPQTEAPDTAGDISRTQISRTQISRTQISRTQEAIHQEVLFKANPKRIYEAITISEQFEKVTQLGGAMRSGESLGNSPTDISPEVGGRFTLFRGHIVGRHIELVPNQLIVQAWREVNWDKGVYSIVKFELIEHESGTRLLFDHTGFPNGHAQHLAEGWRGNYWEPLQKYLA